MSEQKSAIGTVGWIDLTVDDASGVRDFYKKVVGFESSDVDMGEYNDYCVHPPGADPVAGICHAKGSNAGLPTAWMIYFIVDDLQASIDHCIALGGEVIAGPKSYGGSDSYCTIRDPAGAVCALYCKG